MEAADTADRGVFPLNLQGPSVQQLTEFLLPLYVFDFITRRGAPAWLGQLTSDLQFTNAA